MGNWIDVAPAGEITVGHWKVVEVQGVSVAVFNVDGEFHAIEDVCTHDGGELTGGELDGEEIVCPRHGARFSVRTGEVLCPPAYENVATYPTRVWQGMVQVGEERNSP